MRVETHPEADAEVAEAVAYYDRESGSFEVGLQFLGKLAAIEERLRDRPVSNLPIYPGTEARFIAVPSFPFVVVAYERTESILVVAVAHTSRRPGYWADRLPES